MKSHLTHLAAIILILCSVAGETEVPKPEPQGWSLSEIASTLNAHGHLKYDKIACVVLGREGAIVVSVTYSVAPLAREGQKFILKRAGNGKLYVDAFSDWVVK